MSAHREAELLRETADAVRSIEGTIHQHVACAALAVISRVVSTRQTRISVRTKGAILDLLKALEVDITS